MSDAEMKIFDPETIPLEAWPAFDDEEILEGNPAHKGIVLFRDPSKRFSIGIWECPPSKFEIEYEGCETVHVLEGSADITMVSTGTTKTIKAGDRYIMPFGARVVWHVKEHMKKVYCMYENEWLDERYY